MFLFLNAGERKYYVSLQELKEPLNSLIDRRLRIIAASHLGLNNDEQLKRRVAALEKSAVYYYTLEKEVYEKSIPDSLIEKYYATTCEARRLHHIFIARCENEEMLNERIALLDSLKGRIRQGDDFAALARRFSQYAPSAVKGGDLGYQYWGEQADLGAEFYNTAFAQDVGAIGGPVESAAGYHLIEVEEIRDLNQPRFDEIKHLIRSKFVRMRPSETEKFSSEFMSEVHRAYKIDFDEANIGFMIEKICQIRARNPGEALVPQLAEQLSDDDLRKDLG